MNGDDLSLLRDFAAHRTEAAFSTLVERHVGLVHSTALRQAGGDAHLAQEIAQKVFILLAQKADKLGEGTVLSAWLYRAAIYTGADTLKQLRRRQQREQEAFMQSQINEADTRAVWRQLAPVLDEAMGELGDAERTVLVLRYFENKTANEIAGALNIGEEAAQKRVTRALEKLRAVLMKRGVVLGSTAIAGAVAANAVTAAPAALAETITTAVLTGTGLTIATVTMTTLQKIAVAAALAVTIGAGLYEAKQASSARAETQKLQAQEAPMAEEIHQWQAEGGNLTDAEIFNRARAAYAALTSYCDEGRTVATLSGITITTKFSIKLARPDLYRVEWTQSTTSASGVTSTIPTEAVWSDGTGNYSGISFQGKFGFKNKIGDMKKALAGATGISSGAAWTVPGAFFKMNWGDHLDGATNNRIRLSDEKVGDSVCYVYSSEKKGVRQTIWIGKDDFLIHQERSETPAEAMERMAEASAKRNPQLGAHLLKTNYTDLISTETHESIILNKQYSPEDFAR